MCDRCSGFERPRNENHSVVPFFAHYQFLTRTRPDEAHLPAKQPKAPQDTRLSHSNAQYRWPERIEATTPQGTPPIGRLKGPSKERFEEIYQKGRSSAGKFVRIRCLPGTGFFGVSAAKSIGCHARRNLAKRRAREAWRTSLGSIPNADIIVIVKVESVEADFQEIQLEMVKLVEGLKDSWAENSESP